MAPKSLGEIVKQSVAIAAFAGIGIVLLANVTGNQHWYKSDYGWKERSLNHLEDMSYAEVKRRYERMLKEEEDARRRINSYQATSNLPSS